MKRARQGSDYFPVLGKGQTGGSAPTAALNSGE